MKFVYLVAALLSMAITALASRTALSGEGWSLSHGMNGFSLKQAPKLSSSSSVDSLTFHTSRLKRVKASVDQRSAISTITHRSLKDGRSNITSLGPYSAQYAVECVWDGVPMSLLFDTGSSDTWAVKSGFRCEDSSGKVHSQQACGFGQSLVEDFSGETIDNVHFSVAYGSGEQASGPMGFSDITCGGVSVSETQVGLANKTYWHGNNITTGILGLAYPSLTSAFFGPIGDEAPWNTVTYPPFLTTAISQGVMEPMFSVAIMKNSSDGVLGWGGIPPIAYDEKTNATTDMIIANLVEQDETAWRYSFYTIVPDGIRWGSTTDEARYPYIVDMGTTMMMLPPRQCPSNPFGDDC